MNLNLEFHRKLRSKRSVFFPTDLHVHSPASADVRQSPRFENLSAEEQALVENVPLSAANNPVDYEAQILKEFPPSQFFHFLVERRNTLQIEYSYEDGNDWAIIAITDHNVCKYSCEVSKHAYEQLSAKRLIVLPGIELTVTYPVSSGSNASAHLLCIFSPNINDSDIRIAINDAAGKNWEFGNPLAVEDLPVFVEKIRHHENYPAICIAAHVGSSEGVQSETRKAILSHLDAAISRIRGELKAGVKSDKEELQENLTQLEGKRNDPDQIALDVLDLVGQCGFDALQVSGEKDEIHYKRLHRYKSKMGRAVPIICSDAHRKDDIFRTESGVPHIKLSDLSASMSPEHIFNSVARALRLGETRFSSFPSEGPQYWISGIEIYPDSADASKFWPFLSNGDESPPSFLLPFSRNLNCLIGGRGSGKSAALEALAFLACESVFNGFDRNRKEGIKDYYSRARATLKGCNLKICWQFLSQEEAKEFPKKAVFASRYFDTNDSHPPVTYFSADDRELLSQQVPEHSIQYFRLGEIEKQAGIDKLRNFFDQICGNQIQEYETNIKELIEKLSEQRKEIVKISTKINELTQSDSPLSKYAGRKKLFDQVNTEKIKEAYEEIDRINLAANLSNTATEGWSTAREDFDLDSFATEVNNFLNDINDACVDDNSEVKPHFAKLAAVSEKQPVEGDTTKTPRQRIADSIESLDTELDNVGEGFLTAKKEIEGSAKLARDELQEKGLPTGSKDREAKKKAFDEAETALSAYCDFIEEWNDLNTSRKDLVQKLLEECLERTKLRQETATKLSMQLKRDLDPSILIIEADAQSQTDKSLFIEWLEMHFSFKDFKFKINRIAELISKGLTPSSLRSLLIDDGDEDETLLEVDAGSAKAGSISLETAKSIADRCKGRIRHECEVNEQDEAKEFWEQLPQEVRDGLISFPLNDKYPDQLKIDDVLALDEIIFDDEPVIRLNDRPKDPQSIPRPIEDLSPGQRCSAILPILLLTGTSPILIDQPEDNMDNRLIRQVIVNILSSIKLRRQVIIATHNPNLPVLGDVEQAIILQGVGEKECEVKAIGDLDSRDVVHQLTEVMEGGREAFQYRQTIYQAHWPGSVSAD